jgi:hypothetical protein
MPVDSSDRAGRSDGPSPCGSIGSDIKAYDFSNASRLALVMSTWIVHMPSQKTGPLPWPGGSTGDDLAVAGGDDVASIQRAYHLVGIVERDDL